MNEFRGYNTVRRGQSAISICTSIPYAAPLKFTKVSSAADMEDVMYQSYASNVISGGYVFNNINPSTGGIDLTVVSNKTISANKDQPLLVNYISEAILKTLAGPQFSLILNGFNSYPSYTYGESIDIITLVGPFIYVFIFQLIMPVTVGGIVYEKEKSLREVMKMMGLKQHVYW